MFSEKIKEINENYRVTLKKIKPQDENEESTSFLTGQKIEIIIYSKNENHTLNHQISITIDTRTRLRQNPRQAMIDLLHKKIKKRLISKCDYLHIFVDGEDHYGLLFVDDKTKIAEKITNTLIIGITAFKNKK